MFDVTTVRYGKHEEQLADLYLPAAARPPVVCLLHGGFWKLPYGREEMSAVAADLAVHGFAVWNLEYARTGGARPAWPATLDDVAAGIDHLAQLAGESISLDLQHVFVAGHSAGGHLALWSAARSRRTPGAVRVRAVAALAPITDLHAAHDAALGNEAVAQLLGGTPAEVPERYATTSPAALLPLGVPQLLLHGTRDETVPLAMSRRYADAARAAGDDVELVELRDTGHMEFLDPASPAHAALRRWLLAHATRSPD